jgi:hypothetical protein
MQQEAAVVTQARSSGSPRCPLPWHSTPCRCGARDVGQERAAKSMPPHSLNSQQHQEALRTTLHSGEQTPHNRRSSCFLSLPMWQSWSLTGTKQLSFYMAATPQPRERHSGRGLAYSLRPKKNDVLGFKICPKTNDVLLNLACVHVHVAMQQSIST